MIIIREASKVEFKEVIQFYKDNLYNNKVRKTDKILIALHNNEIVWCVRLCIEYKKTLLRWMWVAEKYQKQWIWTQLLENFSSLIQEVDCYCLPYSHLVKFYEKIGFEIIEIKKAPMFLQKRIEKYKKTEKYPCLIMKKICHK